MDDKRPKIQRELAFTAEPRGEAPKTTGGGTESSPAKHPPESLASIGRPSSQPNRRVRTRTHGGVTGKAREGLPMSISCWKADAA